MEQHLKPHIEVTITPEMRALFIGQNICGKGTYTRDLQHQRSARKESSRQLEPRSGWTSHCLRRDGKRPLKFEGLQIASYNVPIAFKRAVLEHRAAIYVDRSNEIYMSLALLLPPDAVARSIFDAGLVSRDAPRRLLSDWNDKVSQIGKRVTLCSPQTDTIAQICSAFAPIIPFCR